MSDKDLYRGKIATAAFFTKNMLANLTAVEASSSLSTTDVMQLTETAF